MSINNNFNLSENNINNKNMSNIYLEKSREIQRIKSLFEFTDINDDDAINKSISLNMSKNSNKANFNSKNDFGMISFSSKNSFNFKKIEKNNNNNDLAINNLIQLIHNNYNDIVEYENNNFQKNYLLKEFNKKTSYKFVKPKENIKNNDKNNNNNNNNKNMKKINFNKFNSLNSSSIYNLFNFIYYDYDKLINSNNFISNKLNLSLTNLFIDTINKFKEQYKNQLDLTEYYFKYNQFKKGKFIFPLFDLIIKAKILINKPGNSATFSYIYKVKNNYKNFKDSDNNNNNNNNEFIHTIKFDLFKKNFCNIWLCSEFEEYKGNLKRISYLQPILPYSKDDSIKFHINIFNVNSSLIPDSIIFTELKIEKIKSDLKYFYENMFMLDKIKISNFRFNEMEFSINIWKNLDNLTDKNFINNVLKIYENNFEIVDVRYEIIKYYVFKIKLIANKIGLILRNKYIGYNIEVIDKDENYINEEQGIGILNSGYNNNEKILKMRKGNILIIYINEIYNINNNNSNNLNKIDENNNNNIINNNDNINN